MEYQVLGPIEGPYFRFLTTFVRAAGRGSVSDPERLEQWPAPLKLVHLM